MKTFRVMRRDYHIFVVDAKSKEHALDICNSEDWCLNDGDFVESEFEVLE